MTQGKQAMGQFRQCYTFAKPIGHNVWKLIAISQV